MNQKPAWMFYAVKARDQLDDSIKSHKRRGHHYDRTIATTHQRACEQFGYRGSLNDWEYLRMKVKLPGMGNRDVIPKGFQSFSPALREAKALLRVRRRKPPYPEMAEAIFRNGDSSASGSIFTMHALFGLTKRRCPNRYELNRRFPAPFFTF